MTKAELITEISRTTGINKATTSEVVESLMETIIGTMAKGENIYLRGFGTFLVKHRAEKTARNITKNTTVIVPAHSVPQFKPSNEFTKQIK